VSVDVIADRKEVTMGWFSKKKDSPPTNMDRYRGKPLLFLLENYVLSSIGCLREEKVLTLTGIVQKVYGGGDDWKATLRSTLHLEDALDDDLRRMWLRNRDIAQQANESLLPEDFARMVVDQNFSSLID
jgi:hypothetical protein